MAAADDCGVQKARGGHHTEGVRPSLPLQYRAACTLPTANQWCTVRFGACGLGKREAGADEGAELFC